MKKIILSLVIIVLELNVNVKTFSKNSVDNNIIKLTIVDDKTNEKLCGVTVDNGGCKKYTDLNGEVHVDINKIITINYISYNDTTINTNKNVGKIIKIKQK